MLVTFFTCVAALAVVLPATALLLLTLAARHNRRDVHPNAPPLPGSRPAVAVLVPAHNEAGQIHATVQCLIAQLSPQDRLLVVADNCSDATAAVARAAGAEVIERHDPAHRGKGYALAFGVDHLRQHPPQVVMVVDADCMVSDHAVDAAAQGVAHHGGPVQLLNLMHAPAGAGLRHRLLEFAMVMKNQVRALGSDRLGGACHLMGTGMALPWTLMARADLATGHIAEDMRLGLDLALAGHPTRLWPLAEISSSFPLSTQDVQQQKSRWEHGHLATIGEQLPRLLRGLMQRGHRRSLAVLALDLVIPPLALYVTVLTLATLTTGLAAVWTAAFLPAALLLSTGCLMLLLAVLLAWHGFGRHLLTARQLLHAPLYAMWKWPIYLAYALRQKSGWVRARRAGE